MRRCALRSSHEALACGRHRFVRSVVRRGWDREVLVEDVIGVVPGFELAKPGERVADSHWIPSMGRHAADGMDEALG
jgi:hypothetical protein